MATKKVIGINTKNMEEGKENSTTGVSFVVNRTRQYLVAAAVHIVGFAIGASCYWNAAGVPSMAESGEFGILSDREKSWITASPMLGSILICPITGYCITKFGRRATLLWSCVPAALAWIFITLSSNLFVILVAQLVVGACGMLHGQVGPIYLAECVEPPIRGMLMCMFELFIRVGTLYIYITGTYFNWHIQAVAAGVIPVIAMVVFSVVPESPYYYVEQGALDKAKESLVWLRASSDQQQVDVVTQEFDEVCKTVHGNYKERDLSLWEKLKDKMILRPIVISMMLMMFHQLSYVNVILNTTVEVLQSAGSTSEYLSTVLIGASQVVFMIIPMALSDKYGRRLFLICSHCLAAFFIFAFGLHFYLKDVSKDYANASGVMTWFPLVALMGYIIGTSIGVVPLAWVVTAEIAPPKAKGLAMGMVGVWNGSVAFAVTISFWALKAQLGHFGGYWLIAGFNLCGLLFSIFLVPETRGKSLEQIQEKMVN